MISELKVLVYGEESRVIAVEIHQYQHIEEVIQVCTFHRVLHLTMPLVLSWKFKRYNTELFDTFLTSYARRSLAATISQII